MIREPEANSTAYLPSPLGYCLFEAGQEIGGSSFPRRRESSPFCKLPMVSHCTRWIPAFAGMTVCSSPYGAPLRNSREVLAGPRGDAPLVLSDFRPTFSQSQLTSRESIHINPDECQFIDSSRTIRA